MGRINLSQVKIASPCTALWSQMQGDDRVRHCSQCKLNVYNIAQMSQQEAEALLEKSTRGERVCARITRRGDGTILTRDCPVGVKLARRAKLKLTAWSAAAFSAVLTLIGFSAISRANENLLGKVAITKGEVIVQPVPIEEPLMGDVAVPMPQQKPKPKPDPNNENPYQFEESE